MTNKKRVFSNFIWRFLERTGAQIVTFVVSIVLARLLDPVVYGTVALVTVITSILQVFVDSGLGNALIQKKNTDDMDFSTVFYFNILVCAVLYTGLFFAAPFIAKFYEMPELTPVIRVLGTILIISGVKNVQQAYVSKNLLFKRFFWATLGGTLTAAVVGIWMAYKGYGVWALVAQYLVNAAMDTIILWITVKFRPKLLFSWKRLGGLFKYGWKLLVSALLDTGFRELRSLIIGKKYSSEDLAFYNKGEQFPKVIAGNINSSIDSVLLPVMSEEQDNRERVKMMTRRAIKTSSFVLWPIMMGLAACAEPIVSLLLTDKWLPCVLFMRVFCITYAFYPIHTANLNAIKAMGRSDLFLILEIIKKVIGLGLILGFMWISVEAMAYSCIISSVASQIINSWPNKKLLKYSYLEQLKDILPSIGLSLFMASCVYCVSFLHLNNWLTLLIQIPLGAIIYIVGAKLFKFEAFVYLLSTAKGFFKRHNNSAQEKEDSADNKLNEDIQLIQMGGKMKRILVLPGTIWQVPLMQKIKEMGYILYLVNPKKNPGVYEIADHFLEADIFDAEKIIDYCKKNDIDLVISDECDIATDAIARYNQAIGANGIPLEIAKLFTNKYEMREFCQKNNLCPIPHMLCKRKDEAIEFFRQNRPKVIMKPIDSNASHGVFTVESEDDILKYFDETIAFSRNDKSVLLEKYIEGTEFTVDGIMTKKGHITLAISEKQHYKHNDNIAKSLLFSQQNDNFDYGLLRKTNDELLNKTKLPFGLTHVEYKFCDGIYYLIEMAARGGGNLISANIVPFMSGVDNYKYLIESSLDKDYNEDIKIDIKNEKIAVLQFIDLPHGGKVKEILGEDYLKNEKSISSYKLNFSIGDYVNPPENDSARVGYYIICANSKVEFDNVAHNIEEKLKIILE